MRSEWIYVAVLVVLGLICIGLGQSSEPELRLIDNLTIIVP